MIELICLQLLPWISINASPVTVQTQDPRMMGFIQFLAVFLGSLFAFVVGYILQESSFDKQNQTYRRNQREDAYMELVKIMADYRFGQVQRPLLIFGLYKAYRYGSPRLKAKIQTIIGNRIPYTVEFLTKDLEEIDEIIYDDNFDDLTIKKPWWQFPKRD